MHHEPNPTIRSHSIFQLRTRVKTLRDILEGGVSIVPLFHGLPFHIRLRHLSDGLPAPDDLPMHLSKAIGQPPEGWVRELLQNGEAILLIDGIDEVPEGSQRNAALNSLRDYVTLYSNCLFIVASRPGAFDKSILKDLNFIVTQLDELSPDQRNVFIDHWHQAYVDNAGISTDDEDLRICRDNLKTALRLQPQIGDWRLIHFCAPAYARCTKEMVQRCQKMSGTFARNSRRCLSSNEIGVPGAMNRSV